MKAGLGFREIGVRHIVAPLLLLSLTIPLFGSPHVLRILIMTGVFIIISQSFNLIAGYTGMMSLCQTAFFGIGAYTSALLALELGAPFLLALTLAGLFCAIISVGIGVPALHLSKHSFVITTLAFLLICNLMARSLEITGGPMGLPGIPPPRLVLPHILDISFVSLKSYYYLILSLDIVVLLALRVLVNSRLGRAFTAIREDEVLAKAMGINTMRYKLLAFSIAAFIAGIAGSFYAHYITYIDPDIFGFYYLNYIVVMVMVGGPGTIWGVTVGAVIFTILPELLRVAKELRLIIFGLILLFSILQMPGGIAGEVQKRWSKGWRKRI